MYNRTWLATLLLVALTSTACTTFPNAVSSSKIGCPGNEVDAYLAQVESLLQRWDDTQARAVVTEWTLLSPVVGELQNLRREAISIKYPDCAKTLADSTIIAMDQTIDMMLAFMANPDDLSISRIAKAADMAWGSVETQLEDSLVNGIDPTHIASLEVLTVQRNAPSSPQGWQEVEIGGTGVRLARPASWPDSWSIRINPDDMLATALTDSDGDHLGRMTTILMPKSEDAYYYLRETKTLRWKTFDAYMLRSTERQFDSVTDQVTALVTNHGKPLVITVATSNSVSTLPPEAFDVLNRILNSIDAPD